MSDQQRNTIKLLNVGQDVDRPDIKKYFGSTKVLSVAIDSKGDAIITFHNQQDADIAVQKKYHTVKTFRLEAMFMPPPIFGNVFVEINSSWNTVLMQNGGKLRKVLEEKFEVKFKASDEVVMEGNFYQLKAVEKFLMDHNAVDIWETKDASGDLIIFTENETLKKNREKSALNKTDTETLRHGEEGQNIISIGTVSSHRKGKENKITNDSDSESSSEDETVAAEKEKKSSKYKRNHSTSSSESEDDDGKYEDPEFVPDDDKTSTSMRNSDKEAGDSDIENDQLESGFLMENSIWMYMNHVPEIYGKIHKIESSHSVKFVAEGKCGPRVKPDHIVTIRMKISDSLFDDVKSASESAKAEFDQIYQEIVRDVYSEEVYFGEGESVTEESLPMLEKELTGIYLCPMPHQEGFVLMGKNADVFLARFKFRENFPKSRSCHGKKLHRELTTSEQSSTKGKGNHGGHHVERKEEVVEKASKTSSNVKPTAATNVKYKNEPEQTLDPGSFVSDHQQILAIQTSSSLLTIKAMGDLHVYVFEGNITHQRTDCIVNAANRYLEHGSGVAGAVLHAAGPELDKECRKIIKKRGPLPVSKVVATTGGKLLCKHVLHAVGPERRDFPEDKTCTDVLKTTFFNCFKKADDLQLQSISVPAISSGIFGVPIDIVASALLGAVLDFSQKKSMRKFQHVSEIYVTLPTPEFVRSIQELFFCQLQAVPLQKKKAKTTTATKSGKNSKEAQIQMLVEKGDQDAEKILNIILDEDDLTRPAMTTRGHDLTRPPMTTRGHGQFVLETSQAEQHCNLARGSQMEMAATPKSKTCAFCGDSCYQAKMKCGHRLCMECYGRLPTSRCPVCQSTIGSVTGNQPAGTMTYTVDDRYLPGFKGCGTIVITYGIPDGVQGDNHPNPGKTYLGTKRVAYLPDNKHGREVYRLLEAAFEKKLIFKVGSSQSSDLEDCVIWDGITHKTRVNGSFGYPDANYLNQVKTQLRMKGITLDHLT